MIAFKYIIVSAHGIRWAHIFPGAISHDEAIDTRKVQPISAGFCTIKEDGRVTVDGFSDSLNLSPALSDPEIIERTLRFMNLGNLGIGNLGTAACRPSHDGRDGVSPSPTSSLSPEETANAFNGAVRPRGASTPALQNLGPQHAVPPTS